MIKAENENFKKAYGVEVINTINPAGLIQVMLASSLEFFLKGVSDAMQRKLGKIRVITEASDQNIKRRIMETKPWFLLLDNRSFRLNVQNLLSFIAEKSPDTKVILLSGCTENKSNLSNVIYLNKETTSSELIKIINLES